MLELIPVPEAFAEKVRATREDPSRGESLTPVKADRAFAFPCRICLRDAEVGEELLLVTYLPFTGNGPYTSANAVFVHAERCVSFERTPEIPDQLRRRLLSVRVYDCDEMMLDAHVFEGTELAEKAAGLLARPGARFLNVYFARPGCFAVRIELRA